MKPNKLTFARRAHAYMVDGKRWSGASAWGKRIEDNTALSAWRAREAVRGVALDDQLRQAVLLADGKDELDDLVERALTAAGANAARDRGTEMHRITELSDLGRLARLTPDMLAVSDRWRRALEAAGIELLDGHVEGVVLVPGMNVCGTFDRLARWRGETVVLDLKTGASKLRYPHSMAVQLALLANAEWITVGDGERNDDRTTWTEFRPLADLGVSRTVGLIVAMPSDGDDAEVHALDLEQGWQAARLAHEAKQWTASKPATLVATVTLTPAIPIPDDPFDGLNGEGRTEIRWTNLLRRYDRLKTLDDGVDALARHWPLGVTTIGRNRNQRPDVEVDEIEAAIERAERDTEAPFDPPPSIVAPAPPVVAPAPVFTARPHPEGADLTEADIDAVRRYIGSLPDDVKRRAAGWQPEAQRAGVSYLFSERQTVRRRQLMRAGVALASLGGSDDDARTIVGIVTGTEYGPNDPVGALIGMLSVGEAQRLIDLCEALTGTGGLALQFDLDGRLTVAGDVTPYAPATA
jgi:hypothetical protein